jgi:adenylate kinase family enzyme
MKIHIIGGTGSGKTTFSKKLASIYNLNIYELDDYYWLSETGYTKKASLEHMQNVYAKIIKKDNYITEGCYYECIDGLLESADKIIFLNPSFFLRKIRIYNRFIKTRVGIYKTKRKPTLKSVLSLIKQAKKFYPTYVKLVEVKLKAYEDRATVLKSKKAIKNYLKNL